MFSELKKLCGCHLYLSKIRGDFVELVEYDRDRFYRVQVGRFNELAKAQKAADALKQDRFPDAFVVAVEE